jgi:hypothetical protein
MVEGHPELVEADLHTVAGSGESVIVCEARMRIEMAPLAAPLLARRSI